MAIFAYEALTQTGRLIQGTLEAGSVDEAMGLLTQMQLKVNALEQRPVASPKGKISKAEFLLFSQQLAAIAKAGIPLEQGLRQMANDLASRRMAGLIQDVAADLEAGLSIEQAIQKREGLFGPLYSRIIRAGVQTGRLPEMLAILNRHLEFASQIRNALLEAMAYPAVVLSFGALVLTGIFLFIVPQFKDILADMGGGRLPPDTRLVLMLSQYVLPFWIWFACLVGMAVLGLAACARSDRGRRFREWLVMHLPVVGSAWHAGIISRFSEAAATLVSAGCELPTCLTLAADATGSERLRAEARGLAEQISQGRPILEAGQFCRVIPRLFLYSAQLGVQRNELQEGLHNLADMYAAQARYQRARISGILLPVLIVILGCMVASTMMGIFMPFVQVLRGLEG